MFQHHFNLIPLATVFIHVLTLANSVDIAKDVHENFCAPFQYASRVEFLKLDNNKYNITVECQKFLPAEAAVTVSHLFKLYCILVNVLFAGFRWMYAKESISIGPIISFVME